MSVVGYDFYGSLCVYQLPFVCGILWNKCGDNNTNKWFGMNCHFNNSNREGGCGRSCFMLFGAALFLLAMILCRMYPIIPHWSKVRMDAFVAIGAALFVVSLRRLGMNMRIMAFLGKHSANIYLIHTFINDYWRFSWLHNGTLMRSGLNFIVLLSLSLLSSIVLEWVKERLGVYKLLNYVKIKLS